MRRTERLKKLVNSIESSNLSTIKELLVEITRVIENPDSTASDLTEIIEIDPPLAAKILHSANSVFYHHPKQLIDIEEAIIWIGFNTAIEIALHHAVCELFQKPVEVQGYSRKALWEQSIATAFYMKMLYRREFGEKNETAYLIGLLHNLGIIILDQYEHEEFVRALKLSLETKKALWMVEEQLMGFSHAALAGEILKNWNMPETIAEPIRFHHQPDQITDSNALMVKVLYIGDQTCQHYKLGYADAPFESKELYSQYMRELGITKKSITHLMEVVKQELSTMEEKGLFI